MTRSIRVLAVGLITAMMLTTAGPALASSAEQTAAAASVTRVTGVTEDGRDFRGRLTNLRVFPSDNASRIRIAGTLVGRVTGEDGERERVRQDFNNRLGLVNDNGNTRTGGRGMQRAAQASCPILNLDIGPIFLDLLGLQLDLSPIELDLTAVPGAGNLLGNLLCAVAGLLDPAGFLSILAQLLQDLIDAIGGLVPQRAG